MYEKISEIPIREEKINKLKTKILAEIDNYTKKIHEDIKQYLINNENDLEDWEFIITEEFSLLRLKEFLEQPCLFQSIEARYENEDIIVYQVSDEDLNIWLQEDYNFTLNFLFKIEHEGFCDVYEILNDRFFGYNFTNIFDKIQYHDRLKQQWKKHFISIVGGDLL